MARLISMDAHTDVPLGAWELASLPPGHTDHPDELGQATASWTPAAVPGTAAGALQSAGAWNLDRQRDFDADDWWYRCTFAMPSDADNDALVLELDGLATLADVWLNGRHILHSDNMFHEHRVEITDAVVADNQLVIRFAALRSALSERKPRPRWRTRLVADQNLRWQRTTLLGRIPGWSPPVAPVGPWKPVRITRQRRLRVRKVGMRTHIDGGMGVADVQLELDSAADTLRGATLAVGDHVADLEIESHNGRSTISGGARIPDVALWWPHTHGPQVLYETRLQVRTDDGDCELNLGHVGFRTIALDREAGDFSVRVNGEPIFCRGACWSTADVVRLLADREGYRDTLRAVRDAGMNMLRVGGTMIYEADEFYELCDELGILVWQDFMFASMDYPAGDPAFDASVDTEARQFLDRHEANPCLAILCGGSEVEQQAAMVGTPAEQWSNDLFGRTLPDICQSLRPDLPYVSSSPTGGTLPFRVDEGTAHYFGVGAYLRPLSDARLSGVRFASECLGFANVPDGSSTEKFIGGSPFVHHPEWKRRVPRDSATGWDFEDVRDHYFELLFDLDPVALRYSNNSRYLAISRVVTGEIMAATFSDWRRPGSSCWGGLVWFLRDLWPGAGWGVIDAYGRPKPAYYYLKRALAPVAVLITDEGLNGLRVHVVNESREALSGRLEVHLLRDGNVRTGDATTEINLRGGGTASFDVDSLLGAFVDSSYAYRFGPPNHDVVVARLVPDGSIDAVSEAFHFPAGQPLTPCAGSVDARADHVGGDAWMLTITASEFVHSVVIDAEDFIAEDNYFHLVPGEPKSIRLQAHGEMPSRPHGFVEALNLRTAARIEFREPSDDV